MNSEVEKDRTPGGEYNEFQFNQEEEAKKQKANLMKQIKNQFTNMFKKDKKVIKKEEITGMVDLIKFQLQVHSDMANYQLR